MKTNQWKHKLYADVMHGTGLTATSRQIGLMVRHVWPFDIAESWLKHELTAKEADVEAQAQLQAAQDAMADAEMRNFEFERAIVDGPTATYRGGPIEADPDYVPDYDKNA